MLQLNRLECLSIYVYFTRLDYKRNTEIATTTTKKKERKKKKEKFQTLSVELKITNRRGYNT
jgi:hypothetical protein